MIKKKMIFSKTGATRRRKAIGSHRDCQLHLKKRYVVSCSFGFGATFFIYGSEFKWKI